MTRITSAVPENTLPEDASSAGAGQTTGFSRRQFTTAAAWAAPVVALAVATPLAAASNVPVQSITISRDNTVTFSGSGDTRGVSGSYGGTLSVTDLPAGAETGALTFTVTIPTGVTVTTSTLPADWTVVTSSPALLVFSGPSLSSTYTTTNLPELAFAGTITAGDLITISIDAANDGYQVADDQLGVS